MLTRGAAEAQFSPAYDLITRLPAVRAAMDTGLVDEPRARVLADWTTELSVEQARAVCDTLLPRVSALTTGQLIEQVKAVAERKVVGYRKPGRFGESVRLSPARRSGRRGLRPHRCAGQGRQNALAMPDRPHPR